MMPHFNVSSAATGNAEDLPAGSRTTVVGDARTLLERHPRFGCHVNEITLEFSDGTLVLTGRLPSFYLKQLLQESLGNVDGVVKLDNRVDVVCCGGISSIPKTNYGLFWT